MSGTTLMSQLLDAAGVDAGDGEWSFTLFHQGDRGEALVWGRSTGELHASFKSSSVTTVLVDGHAILPQASLPQLEHIRDLRTHFDRCAEACARPPFRWSQPFVSGPHGSTVTVEGMPDPARRALQAWWLGGEPTENLPPPVTRFERFVPAATTASARKPLRSAFKLLDEADDAPGWPTKRIVAFARDPILVQTLIAWASATRDRDLGYLVALNVLAIEGSREALGLIERRVAELLESPPDLRELWQTLAALRESCPDHALTAALRDAWISAFDPTPGGRLLASMGVRPPTNGHWEVVLMGRQDDERTHLFRGDCVIEIYPHGFFRAAVHVAGPRQEALELGGAPEAIEQIREHFDHCAREAKLDPWRFGKRWHPKTAPNGGIVTVKGFSDAEKDIITAWFRAWKPASAA